MFVLTSPSHPSTPTRRKQKPDEKNMKTEEQRNSLTLKVTITHENDEKMENKTRNVCFF